MNRFIWNIILAFVWVVVTGVFSMFNFLAGFLLAAVVIVLSEPKRIRQGYARRILCALEFMVFYLGELLLSNFRVAIDVLSPRPGTLPALVSVHLEEGHTDASITLLANLITMTPGTMSLDVSQDRRWLYIHAMFVEDVDRFREQFKRDFERRVLDVTR